VKIIEQTHIKDRNRMLKRFAKHKIKERWSQENKIVNDFYSFEPVRK
jgi:hypothetical protein